MAAERKLAAVMFTDVVGYAALMAESEERGRRTRQRHREIVRPLVEQHGGEWIEAPGDESLSTFPSALEAVRCALAVQAALRDDAVLRLRIGIHSGDVVFEGEEIHGDGVNVASRIRPLAEPGGICVSGEVYHSVRNQPGVEARSLGEQTLKNVSRPVEVWAIGTAATRPTPSLFQRFLHADLILLGLTLFALALFAWYQLAQYLTAAPELGPIRSLAVLPLENLSGDPEQEYFADGMTEAVISEFARIRSLPVISRTSVMQYKRARKPLPEIAEELGVEWVVEGTVMRAGDRVRITVQLIDARNDLHLWSESYDRELSDVLDLHSEVARAVAGEVDAVLRPEEEAMLAASRPVDPAAYDAYLRGLQLAGTPAFSGDWRADLRAAIEQFERAVELDPDFAEAWARLAVSRGGLAVLGLNLRYRSELPKARLAAQRALELDDRMGGVHALLGAFRLHYDWDFAGARRAYERALQLSPSDPLALNHYAWYLLDVGRSEEALAVSERLLRVAPLDVYWRAEHFRFLFFARQYERALEELERIRELEPGFVVGEVSQTYLLLGRHEEGYRELIAVYEGCGARCEPLREAADRGWAQGGWDGVMRAVIEVYSRDEGFSPLHLAWLHVAIGETDEAFALLERAYSEREPLMTVLKMDARFDPLRSDPRFDDLLRRIGFPESDAS